MDEMAVNDRDAVALFKPKVGKKPQDGEAGGEFQKILNGVSGAAGAPRGPAHEKHDNDSLHGMFGNGDQEYDPRESASARDDMRDDGGPDHDEHADRDDRRPREGASSGAGDSRDSDADAAARGRNDSGGDTADRGETDAKMSKSAEKSDGPGKDSGEAGAGRNQNGGENQNAGAGAAAAAAQGQGQAVQGAAESAAGQAQRGAQGQTAEGQNQAAGQAAAQAAAGQKKKSGADDSGGEGRKQAQEQSIAAKLKPGQAVKVEVKTSDESKTLISRPVIAQAAEGADDGAAQAQRAGGPGARSGGTIAQQAQQAQGQGQNQGGEQAQQAQAQQIQVQTAALQTAAKGPSASGPQAAGSVSGASAGGEGAQASTQSAQQRSETPQQTEQARQGRNAHDTHQTRARVVEQISVQIAKAAAGGANRIQVTLKPAELGRVEIQIEMTHDGRAAAVVTADNKETLEMLRRDAGELAKALQDAGLKTGAGDLSFNLRGENAHADAGDGKSEGSLFDGEGEDGGEDGEYADGDMPLPEDARLPQQVGVRGLAGVNLVA